MNCVTRPIVARVRQLPKRETGGTVVTVASLPWLWWNSSRSRDVHVAHAVAVGHHERIAVRRTSAIRLTRPPVMVFRPVSASVTWKSCSSWLPWYWICDLLAEADGEVVVHRLVVQEIFLDHVAAIAEAEHEIAEPVVGVELHDVPQDRPAADLDHGLGRNRSLREDVCPTRRTK